MKVLEALQDEGLPLYYRRKFLTLAEKAGITDLDLEKDWKLIKRQLHNTFSFNGAALLGSIWGAYRQAPYWPLAIGLNVILIAAGIMLHPPSWVVNLNILGVMYIWVGNSLLLIKFLRAKIRFTSMALVDEHMQPNPWLGTLAAMIAVGTLGAAIFTDLKHQLASYDQDKDVVMMAPSVDADPATDHNEAASMTAPFVENAADAGAVALDDDGEGSIEGYPEPQRSNFIRSCESTTNTRYLQTMGSAAPSGYASSMCACVMNYMEGDLPIEEFVQYDLAMSRGESGTHPETERKMGSYLGFCVRDYANSAAN